MVDRLTAVERSSATRSGAVVQRWGLVLLLALGMVVVSQTAVPCDVAAIAPDCWVALRPGPVEDALALVDVEGRPTSASVGELLLTTVSVDPDLGYAEWLQARRDPRYDDVLREQYFPSNVDDEQTREEFAVMMEVSQQRATFAALRELGFDLSPRGAEVREVVLDTPADGEVVAGDVLTAVDGEAVSSPDDVVAAVRDRGPGVEVVLEVEGAGTGAREVPIVLGTNPDDATAGYLGLLLVTAIDLPVDVEIDAGSIGGPSAGLVFALSIVDLLDDRDLTGGRVVAATGEIDADGNVGAIGGIRQKVVGVTARGDSPPAEVFIVPRANLGEARSASVDREVTLVPVDTLGQAVEALAAVRAGDDPVDAVALAPAG